MPDFDRLHNLAAALTALTEPGQQEPGLAGWCMMTGQAWKQIAEMWSDESQKSAACTVLIAEVKAGRIGPWERGQ